MPVTDQSRPAETANHAALRSLALKAMGLSGADIERLVREARQKARRGNRPLAFSDIFDLLAAARPERSQEVRWRVAIHEAGHAAARLALGLGRITSITIDGPTGGYIEGKMPNSQEETEAFFGLLIVVTLAGRAAEEELLGIGRRAGEVNISTAGSPVGHSSTASNWPIMSR